jgi:hypothetical protein
MYSEQLAIMLFMALTQASGHLLKPQAGPVLEDGRQAIIRAVREPELMAALSHRARRVELSQSHSPAGHTLLASAN